MFVGSFDFRVAIVNRTFFLPLLLCLLLASSLSAQEVRIWKSSNGKYSIEAKLLSYQDGELKLAKPDGSTLTVELSKLSSNDKKYVESLKLGGKEKNPSAGKGRSSNTGSTGSKSTRSLKPTEPWDGEVRRKPKVKYARLIRFDRAFDKEWKASLDSVQFSKSPISASSFLIEDVAIPNIKFSKRPVKSSLYSCRDRSEYCLLESKEVSDTRLSEDRPSFLHRYDMATNTKTREPVRIPLDFGADLADWSPSKKRFLLRYETRFKKPGNGLGVWEDQDGKLVEVSSWMA